MSRDFPAGRFSQNRMSPQSIALVDIGSHKTVVMLLVADTSAPCGWRIAGIGNQFSRGIKARVVMQTDDAVQSFRAALTQAERMAGIAAGVALLTYGCGRLTTLRYEMRGGGADAELVGIGQAAATRSGFCPLHTDVATSESGGAIVTVHAAEEGPVRALMHIVERADLEIAGVMPSALAAGLSVTDAEERQAGVTVLDLGAGASTAAFFSDGRFAGSIAVPVGGATMTFDIARELQVPVQEAERIKLNCGMMTRAQSFVHGALGRAVRPSQSDETHEGATIQLRQAHSLIAERAASLIGLVADRVAAAPAARGAVRSVVLTGGVSQMDGLVERAEALLGVPVRVARPADPGEMFVDSLMTPAFGTAIGAGHALAGAAGGWWFVPAAAFDRSEDMRVARRRTSEPASRPKARDHVS